MELPDLQTRKEVQGYLRGLSAELGLPITDPEFAAALDSRDQLGGFRNKFYIPKIGQLLDERSIAEGISHVVLTANTLLSIMQVWTLIVNLFI